MKLFNIAALALVLTGSSLASPVISQAGSVFDGNKTWPVYPMHFTGSVTTDGPVLDLYGSVQELIPKIQKLDPKWTPPKRKNVSRHEPGLVKRYFHGDPVCNPAGAGDADLTELEREVIPYLQGLGTGNCGAYAHSCSRVSCAWDSAVFLCNNNPVEIHVSCERIGDAAQHIVSRCVILDGVCGYWPDTTGYSVSVQYSSC
ncbi:hypothetical protein TWF694_004478 [Orbilia ellipsospora]|uniref:Secreted protein n=1 Tax=Orbilia ellipsospora TaxID=2528407 RepID=A0AAV9WWD2_9PEZI